MMVYTNITGITLSYTNMMYLILPQFLVDKGVDEKFDAIPLKGAIK